MLRVEVLPSELTQRLCPCRYDLGFFTCGYEARSRFVAEFALRCAAAPVVAAFDQHHVHAFDSNWKWYSRQGVEPRILSDDAFEAIVQSELRRAVASREERPVRVLLDVSSITRHRMAVAVDEIERASKRTAVVLDIVYAVARYSAPPAEGVPIESVEPVSRRFAGWSEKPEAPLAAIFGLGYEPDRVVGVSEYLEPSDLWTFIPRGVDDRFFSAVERANAGLWQHVPEERRVLYVLTDPLDAFVRLESLCYGILRTHRPIIVPFGPKLFAAASLLVALLHEPHIAVWNATSGSFAEPRNIYANGEVMGLRVVFHKSESAQ